MVALINVWNYAKSFFWDKHAKWVHGIVNTIISRKRVKTACDNIFPIKVEGVHFEPFN